MNLSRSRNDRKLAGVLGGIAESLGVNVTFVRLLYIALLFITGFFPMMLLYGLLVFILPNKDGF